MSARVTTLALTLVLAVLAGGAQPGAAQAPAVRVDGAAALRHVERLVAIGPRVAGSPGGERARTYIVGELRKAGVEAEVRTFEAATPQGRLRMANVVARLPGRRPDVVVLAGHYDTKLFKSFRFVGANDGGSSAALLIELARRLAKAPREYTLWLVWFDGEEAFESWTATDSLYGSRHLAAELARTGRLPRALVLVDILHAMADRHPLGERGAARLLQALPERPAAGGGRPRAVPEGGRARRVADRLRLSTVAHGRRHARQGLRAEPGRRRQRAARRTALDRAVSDHPGCGDTLMTEV